MIKLIKEEKEEPITLKNMSENKAQFSLLCTRRLYRFQTKY
jgi:hypothetical protein